MGSFKNWWVIQTPACKCCLGWLFVTIIPSVAILWFNLVNLEVFDYLREQELFAIVVPAIALGFAVYALADWADSSEQTVLPFVVSLLFSLVALGMVFYISTPRMISMAVTAVLWAPVFGFGYQFALTNEDVMNARERLAQIDKIQRFTGHTPPPTQWQQRHYDDDGPGYSWSASSPECDPNQDDTIDG